MDQPVHVRVFCCTNEVRSLTARLPLDGLLPQEEKALTVAGFEYPRACLLDGRQASIEAA